MQLSDKKKPDLFFPNSALSYSHHRNTPIIQTKITVGPTRLQQRCNLRRRAHVAKLQCLHWEFSDAARNVRKELGAYDQRCCSDVAEFGTYVGKKGEDFLRSNPNNMTQNS